MKIFELADKHVGKPCFIVGAGPSLHFQDLTPLKKHITIAVNSGICKVDFANYFVTDDTDVSNWSYFRIDLPKLKSCVSLLYKAKMEKCFNHIKNKIWYDHKFWYVPKENKYYDEGLVFTKDPKKPIIGARTSTGSAIHLAHIMGCDPIILLGSDCCYAGNKRYFWQFEGEKKPYRLDRKTNFCAPNHGRIGGKPVDHHSIAFIDYFKNLARHAENQNINIINASGGILECFKKEKYEALLKRLDND